MGPLTGLKVLDLKTEGGRTILKRLAAKTDVLVENFGPGVMERLGFGYEDLKAGNPGLIYCSLSGFGRTGPYSHRRGFDLVAQAMSGIMSFTGEAGGPPAKCGPPLSDITAGIIAAVGILAAYAHRLKTGEGQWVETSLFEAALVQTYWQAAIALATLEAIGAPELADDPRFRDNAGRMAHLKELEQEFATRLRTKPAAHWLHVLEEKGVPCGPVNDMLQALSDPQTLARIPSPRRPVRCPERLPGRPRSRVPVIAGGLTSALGKRDAACQLHH